ncbi:hypothetical protein ACK2M7_03950 [Chryseobacterium sp. TY4]
MKFLLTALFIFFNFIVFDQNSPVDEVSPLMGQQSKPSLSNGNTYPAVNLPWGKNHLHNFVGAPYKT